MYISFGYVVHTGRSPTIISRSRSKFEAFLLISNFRLLFFV